MPKIKDILKAIEQYAPLELQEEYDNAGVQIGDVHQEATGALLCLDVTEEIIDEAIEHGCNLIIAHHPLVFRALKSLTGINYIERCVIKACKNDITIYAAHTNLDNAPGGVSYRMADMLGLLDIRLLTNNPESTTGCGVVGLLVEEMEEIDFLQLVKRVFHVPCLLHSTTSGKMIKEVAICSGSGAFMIKDAIKYGADAFITGEAKYNDYYDVENQILLSVIGHYESEICTKEMFNDILSKKFPTFAVHFSNVNSNPIKYL